MLKSKIFKAVLAAASLFAVSGAAFAQDFPTRPVTFIVPWAAGGATDITIRALAEAASKHLGQPIIIENKAGGGGTVGGATMAASAKPDGYTIAQIPISIFRYPIMQGATYDPVKDFTYIANIAGYVFASYCSTRKQAGQLERGDRVRQGQSRQDDLRFAGAWYVAQHRHGVDGGCIGRQIHRSAVQEYEEVNLAVAGNHTVCGATGLDAKPLADAGKLKFVNVWTGTPNPSFPACRR